MKDNPFILLVELQIKYLILTISVLFLLNHSIAYSQNKDDGLTAHKYSENLGSLSDSATINEIQIKYESEKKEKEFFQLKAIKLDIKNKQLQNQIFLFGTLGILSLAFLLVFIFLKNSKKNKTKLSRELLMQELNGIDTIIDIQEKERNRIAYDFHDNLGSKIATMRLFIETISSQESTGLEERNQLLNMVKTVADESYKEIRKIANNKSLGSRMNKGLIPAIVTIANQISFANKINIEVIQNNVSGQINSKIEIQVFRIILELLSYISYSKASNSTIQFSEEDKTLTVIINYYGKGIDTNKISIKFEGDNFKKRLERIEGNMVVDPRVGSENTIILSIPL